MGMSMHVVGFRPADDQWKKMKAAWDACKEIGVSPPKEVYEFFDGCEPGDAPGQEVSIGANGVWKWTDIDGYREGYELDITALPNGVRFLRFYCSW